jgi:hypothetical protein
MGREHRSESARDAKRDDVRHAVRPGQRDVADFCAAPASPSNRSPHRALVRIGFLHQRIATRPT